MQANIKKNDKNFKVKILVDSRYTYTEINKQLVKDKRIHTKPINFSFEVFNMDRTKNREMTRVVPLKIKINRHKEQLKTAVTDLNGTDMFLEYNQLVKHNQEVNWKNGMIQFIRCLESCKIKYQDIKFRTRRTQATENKEQDNRKIGKKPDTTNPEDLLEYICPFIHLFNKKKFKKLPE